MIFLKKINYEDIDKEYDQSHIEEELRSIDEGRRLDFKPIQGDNQ